MGVRSPPMDSVSARSRRDTAVSEDVGPWLGFAHAAEAAVRALHQHFGLDLWMATHVQDDQQLVVASTGPWTSLASPGHAFPWSTTFCAQMVAASGPTAVPDVRRSPYSAPVAVGASARVRAYAGVPLLSGEDELFGTLCAFSGTVQPPSMRALREPMQLAGRMLSTILAGERATADRSREAAEAYALAERDRLTGLRNRRGWDVVLDLEDERSRHYGGAVSVVVLDLEPPARTDVGLLACAALLREVTGPGAALAHAGGGRFTVLAVECDVVSARALAVRLRVRLRVLGVPASLGVATRRPHEGLQRTCQRAGDDAARHRRTGGVEDSG